MQFQKITPYLKGALLCIVIALSSSFASAYVRLNSILLSLIMGIVLGNTLQLSPSFNKGIKLSSGRFLEFAIILMAFSIDYGSFLKLGWQTIFIVIVTIFVVLASTLFLSKKMNCPSNAGLLVGFGTAICGSSAIAALAPTISEDKSDMGISMAVVNLYGLIGMIVLPLFAKEWFTDIQSSVLLGASLHSVGNVAGAGVAMSDAIGEMAVTVKLGRVALLTPALLIFTQFMPTLKNTKEKGKLKLPYYLVTFILISIVFSIIPLPLELLAFAKKGSNFLLAIAMAAIGLKVSFKSLFTSGKKGLVFGAILFVVQLITIITLLLIFNLT